MSNDLDHLFGMFLLDDRCDDFEELRDVIRALSRVPGDDLWLSTFELEQVHHSLSIREILLLHDAPDHQTLANGVPLDESFELFEAVTSLD